MSSFYIVCVFGLSSLIRMIFITEYWQGKFVETTHSMPLIKLCEACYLFRHEEDLVREDETYRLIQEIIRTDALFKAMTGSSLKGDIDPTLCDLSTE